MTDSSEDNDDVFVERRRRQERRSPKRRVTDLEWVRWRDRTRDACFLILGLAGTANQLFFATPPNPVLYPILAALLGLPFALALDERRRKSNEDERPQ